ncbi:BREX-1 system adenine-specific DNA-methyltransferase PglX [Hephaestia sp. GCM10023244]|uniref:BREX-1 system adenine-specific DNA-methyltransferase PglX n=1 Tax=unclassified Hephaestia TaxID=2631281 RepID=UPI0020778C23|nr:BREX-1 system adenine-specific DNA-methyltransferase PglX [Hephaestia sp. MAHUQ-44]MCM8731816.1 BREX-1 system adenine-specific DNA-methyltransferase PglX [Hephaestia sp. MAHUQ-44]
MSDSALFISGSLFTTDYLVEAVTGTPAYVAVDVATLRARLDGIADAFPQNHRTNESQTEDDFIWPVLAALGWTEWLRQQNLTVSGRDDVPDGLLFADAEAKAAANAHNDQWRRYQHGLAVVESKRWARPLDRASGRDEATAPSTQMLRYLRRIDDLTSGKLRWGILTNGTKWRLYWAGARSVSEEFLEVDLGRVLALDGEGDLFASEADRDHWLRVFAVMFSRDAFIKDGTDDRSFHERARAAAAFYEERVAASLSKLVFEQVFPSLAMAIANAAPQAPLQDVREASLVLLYRLLFLLYAEDRDLLPVSDKRYDDYALRPLRIDVGKRVSEGDALSSSASRIWSHIADLSRIIDKGDVSVGIPPYNGGLFGADGASLLESVRIADNVMAPALDALSYERSTGERRYINYRDLSVQQLGSIYERLLEFEIVRDASGTLAVRPNLFARKNTGSYYTPDELVGLILDETLEPLITERLDAFRTALGKLNTKNAEDYQRRELRDADPANAILSLRVCDPAMGSGHFLVSLVDTLADHVLDAMAEAASLGTGLAYTSPLADKIEDIRTTILKNAKAANWTIDEAQLDDRHIVRRMVLKRCVYGVDKNPMAVELAKVALWLHTFTVGAPLSFIDHHLRAGDSLFGLWVREAIDKAGALGGELLWNEALRNAQRSAEAMKTIEALTDVEIAEAHRSAAMYQDVELMTGELDGFVSFIHALDWLNLNTAGRALVRLWLDGRFGDPIPIARGKKAPEGGKAKLQEVEAFTAIWERARALIEEEGFLNWQISFPGVWDNWASKGREGGFDAVVGNPPWDRFEFEELPWFAARDAAIATEPLKSKRKAMIAALKTSNPQLLSEFETAQARQRAAAKIVRSGKIYSELNSGKLNIYKIFVERAISLVKSEGMVGLLTPIGIGTDHNVASFLRKITQADRLKAFVAFENKRRWLFADVHAEDQPTIFCVGGSLRTFSKFVYGVKLNRLPTDPDAPRTVTLTRETLTKVNPTTGTMPIFRSMTDLGIVAKIYDGSPVLIDGTGHNETPVWPIKYRQMINMTSRSEGFRTAQMLAEQEGAWPAENGEFDSPAGRWLRLYEGKMVSILNHRYAGVQNRSNSVSGQGQPIHSSMAQLADPSFLPIPRYWILESDAAPDFPWAIGFNDVCNTNNARSLISAIVPSGAYGNTLPLLTWTSESLRDAALLQGNLSSIPTDYVARQKIQSRHLNKYILAQLPVVPPAAYARLFGSKSAADIVRETVLELSYTAHDLAPFAHDLGHVDANGDVLPPFIWDEERRLHLRAKLDALYFILYGVFDPADPAQSREDIRYIYSTFPIIEREETARWGSYRSRDLCLAWINALMAGQPDAFVTE